MKTQENLKNAFSGESQASRRYAAYAEKAEQEGLVNVSRLFRAAAQSETIHARAHLRALGEIKDTLENLRTAISGENYEHTSMYPKFIDEALQEKQEHAATSFRYANEAEKAHEKYFKDALSQVENGTDASIDEIWVCSGCGYTMLGEAPEKCPLCGAPKASFLSF